MPFGTWGHQGRIWPHPEWTGGWRSSRSSLEAKSLTLNSSIAFKASVFKSVAFYKTSFSKHVSFIICLIWVITRFGMFIFNKATDGVRTPDPWWRKHPFNQPVQSTEPPPIGLEKVLLVTKSPFWVFFKAAVFLLKSTDGNASIQNTRSKIEHCL